jgi:hypothetical protein
MRRRAVNKDYLAYISKPGKREAKREWQREYMRKRRKDKAFLAQQKVYDKQLYREYRRHYKELLQEFRKNGCLLCPEKEHCCLDAHHVQKKSFEIGRLLSNRVSPEKVVRELKKCVCLCSNCHRKLHAGLLVIPPEGAG